jgi:subtilisin family serine protease
MIRALQSLRDGPLAADAFPDATGAGVRVAVIDSGVDAERLAGARLLDGATFDAAGARTGGALDHHGHGTAVVTTLRAIAPDVAVLPVKVFDRELRTTADALVAALDWAAGSGVHLINLSLGTTNLAHRRRLGEALIRAARLGVTVAAADIDEHGTAWWPGGLPLAVGVTMDGLVPQRSAIVAITQEGAVRRLRARAPGVASGFSGGVPPSGVSFAVATVTGLLALHLASSPPA